MFFKSDNSFGVSKQILDDFIKCAEDGSGYTAYGNDDYTEEMRAKFSQVFEKDVDVYNVSTGTAANSLALAACTPPYGMVFCHKHAHIIEDECNAPEFFSGGAKFYPINTANAKITLDSLEKLYDDFPTNFAHSPQPKTVSITQATEYGSVYSLDEINKISKFCKDKNLYLHMDGARFANALVSLGISASEMSWMAGVDILSFGAIKNGAMNSEAVVIFNDELKLNFEFYHKRAGQLLSKNRFFAIQLTSYLKNGLWLNNARNANEMARYLVEKLSKIDGISIAFKVEANEVFVIMPRALSNRLLEAGVNYYDMGKKYTGHGIELRDDQVIIRLVTSFASTKNMIDEFIQCLIELL